MAKMKVEREQHDTSELIKVIDNSDVWLLMTAKANSKGPGAEIAIRESYDGALVNTIAMLLEQKEIYDAVQAKIAQVKMMDKRRKKSPPDLNVN